MAEIPFDMMHRLLEYAIEALAPGLGGLPDDEQIQADIDELELLAREGKDGG